MTRKHTVEEDLRISELKRTVCSRSHSDSAEGEYGRFGSLWISRALGARRLGSVAATRRQPHSGVTRILWP